MNEIDTLARHAQQKKSALQLRMISKDLRIARVFGRRLLIKLVVPETELDNAERAGIIVVNKKEHTPMSSCGVVVMLGTALTNEDLFNEIPPEGAMVMFSRYAGTDMQVEEEQFRIIHIDEIMCEFAAKGEGVGWEVAEQ